MYHDLAVSTASRVGTALGSFRIVYILYMHACTVRCAQHPLTSLGITTYKYIDIS